MGRYKRDNSGGFGNPPIKGQRKKGDPGGPGRPKGSMTMDAALRKVLGGKISYTVNGEKTEGPATLALAQRALALGLSGPMRANEAIRDLAKKYEPVPPEQHQLPCIKDLTEEEQLELLRLIRKAQGVPYEGPKQEPIRYYSENWPDGIVYRCCHSPHNEPPQLEEVRNRAYISAALPGDFPLHPQS
jgi:hypothetical protein